MSDLIERSKAIQAIYWNVMECNNIEMAESVLKDVPTVDTVEVVRCKDCKFCTYEPCKDYENVYICNRTYWSRSDGGLLPNHYCAWGDRREDEID